MSTLNNQPDDDAVANEVLREVMIEPDHAVSEVRLRAAAVDIDMLTAMYEKNLAPFLKFLHGYQDLLSLDPAPYRTSQYDKETHMMVSDGLWGRHLDFLSEGDPRRFERAIKVMNVRLYWHNQQSDLPSNIIVALFLTRKGEWVLWYAHHQPHNANPVDYETVGLYATISDMWTRLHELVPDEYTIQWEDRLENKYTSPSYLPLYIEQRLRTILAATIAERQERLDSMTAAHEAATARVSTVKFTPH